MAIQSTRKHSKQRDAIIDLLANRKDHPSADTIYREIRTIIPNISLGTVYRNLSLLAECGEIQKLSCDGKVDRFDGNSTPHYHFICKKCDCIYDLPLPYNQQLDNQANALFEGKITGHSLIFEGYCNKCNSSK